MNKMLHHSEYSSDKLYQLLTDDVIRCLLSPIILKELNQKLLSSVQCVYRDNILAFYIYDTEITKQYKIHNILDEKLDNLIEMLENGWKNCIFQGSDGTYSFEFPFILNQNYLIKITERYKSLQFKFNQVTSYLDWLSDELLIEILFFVSDIDSLSRAYPRTKQILENPMYVKYMINQLNPQLNDSLKYVLESNQVSPEDQIQIIRHLLNNVEYWSVGSLQLPLITLTEMKVLSQQKILFEVYLKYKLGRWHSVYNIYMKIFEYNDSELDLDKKYQIIKDIIHRIAIRIEIGDFDKNDEVCFSISDSILSLPSNYPYIDCLRKICHTIQKNQK